MGTRLNRLGEAVLTSTHNLCFEQKYEKDKKKLSENFHFFFGGNISMYLNRHVFIMYFENRILLKPALGGVCSLATSSVGYEETQ